MLQFPEHGRSAEAAESPDFDALFAAEDRHFWFSSRNRVIRDVVQKLVASLPPGYRVLEVGCGTGNVLRVLEDICRNGEVIGSDLFEEGLAYARRRVRCSVVQADVYQLAFTTPFELIGMFDVLEHLPDDQAALAQLYRILSPGGRVVLTVPAHQALWSYADAHAGHYRRYAPRELHHALTTTGFRVEFLSQFMMPLLPLLWASRRLSALLNRCRFASKKTTRELALSDLTVVPVLNACLAWLLRWEAPWLARRRRLPLGTSLLAVAARPPRTATTSAA